ncbi:MAG: BMP family ABC transporter substrate-binding protein, partial [Chloroflexota bacterium]
MDARIPFVTRRRAAWRPLAIAFSALLVLGACASPSPDGGAGGTLKVFGAFATQIEEPWDGVIHAALQAEADAGRIEYTFADDIGYAGDMERVLRETAEQDQPDIIFGDAFGNEEAVRAVAADYPD